ncbi:MAG TPA: YlxR family protein [Actinomycetota bacterium]|nr:YlxR family protein [Actinomycetota bacterium]
MACRTRRTPDELLRLARDPAGTVSVDPAGTAPGRGAYVCRRAECVRAATTGGTLARALRTGLGSGDLATLRNEMEKEIG